MAVRFFLLPLFPALLRHRFPFVVNKSSYNPQL